MIYNDEFNLLDCKDPRIIAGILILLFESKYIDLIKKFLKELKTPLIPFDYYEIFLNLPKSKIFKIKNLQLNKN